MDRISLGTRKVSIEFPGVKALNQVDFEVSTGEIRAVVGANGAGKSTLMKVLAGEDDKIYDPASDKYGVDVVEVPGSAILATQLQPDSTVENLANVAPDTYGNLAYLSVADWMPAELIH